MLGIIKHFINTIKSERGEFGTAGKKIEQGAGKVFDRIAGDSAQQIQAAGAMSPEELKQYQGSFDLGNTLKQIELYQQGLGQAPGGYLDSSKQYLQQTGQMGQALYNQVLQGITNPDSQWESTLQPQLQLATQNVNQQANTRGLLNSGVDLQNLGTAGVEAAVADAQGRMANRQQQVVNASSLAGNIYGVGQQNLSNLANLYNQQQQLGSQQKEFAAQYQAYPYQAQLGQAYGMENAYINNAMKFTGSGLSGPMGISGGSAPMQTGGQQTTSGGGSNIQGLGGAAGNIGSNYGNLNNNQYGYIPQSQGGLTSYFNQNYGGYGYGQGQGTGQ